MKKILFFAILLFVSVSTAFSQTKTIDLSGLPADVSVKVQGLYGVELPQLTLHNVRGKVTVANAVRLDSMITIFTAALAVREEKIATLASSNDSLRAEVDALQNALTEAQAEATKLREELAAANAAQCSDINIQVTNNTYNNYTNPPVKKEWKEKIVTGGIGIGVAAFDQWNYDEETNQTVAATAGHLFIGNPGKTGLLFETSFAGGAKLPTKAKQNDGFVNQNTIDGRFYMGSADLLFNLPLEKRKGEKDLLFSIFAGGGAGFAGWQPRTVWSNGYQLQAKMGMIVKCGEIESQFTVTLPIAGNVVNGNNDPFSSWSARFNMTYRHIGAYVDFSAADYKLLTTHVRENKGFNIFPNIGVFFAL